MASMEDIGEKGGGRCWVWHLGGTFMGVLATAHWWHGTVNMMHGQLKGCQLEETDVFIESTAWDVTPQG